nr:FMN-binding negative transcriptional regulator [Pseudemcibacter aquimaris]
MTDRGRKKIYQPKIFKETRLDVIHELIREHSFATLVTQINGELCADHLPFILNDDNTKLLAHISKANPLWKKFKNADDVMVIFQGPHHYISPNWYPSKQEHHKEVPTWNYAVVQVQGSMELNDDPEWLLSFLNNLTDKHENDQEIPWKVSDAPDDYIAQQLKAIAGIEVTINTIDAKWKMGQNKPAKDIKGAVSGLSEIDTNNAAGVAELMNKHTD